MKAYRIVKSTSGISREEWLEVRRGGLGGSDIGAIVGVNKYSSAYEVFMTKVNAYDKDLSENEAVYWGTVLEDVVAREFSKRTGKRVKHLNAVLASRETPYAYANVDRMIVGENAGLECKTTNAFSCDNWKENEIPSSYLCQCQWYMYVMGCDYWYIACLIGGQHFTYQRIDRDDELISLLLASAKEFWENNILAKEPPAPDASRSCTEYIREHYAEDNGCTVILTSDIAAAADELFEVKQQEKCIKERRTELENKIKQYMGEAQRGECKKYEILWKTQRGAAKLNVAALAEDYGIADLSNYYLPAAPVRKFILKEQR